MIGSADSIAPEQLSAWCDEITNEGFVVLPGVLSDREVARYRSALAPWISAGPKGRNTFEGRQTHRVYGLLAKDPCFAELIAHPTPSRRGRGAVGHKLFCCQHVWPLTSSRERVISPGIPTMRISGCRRPHDIFGISVFWALDDTTEENGATEVLPPKPLLGRNRFSGCAQRSGFRKSIYAGPM